MPDARVHSVQDAALGNTSYLVEAGDGTALCIDARRDADGHRSLAARLGVRIVAALETHLHADFVSGSRELAADGAQIIAATDARLAFPHRGVRGGERLSFGDIVIEVVPTPGHTPEHVSYLASIGASRALFSGGSLIVGGAARTDLTGADRTDALARAQFASLRTISALPGETALHPTHGAGSFCSTGPARSHSGTIGDERATNPLLAIHDEDAFVDALRAGFGSYPTYFLALRDLNRAGAPLLSSLPAVPRLSGSAAFAASESGAWLIDARPIDRWAQAHAASSISIELRDSFASWLGWVVPFGEAVVLILDEPRIAEAIRLAYRIGYDAIAGWLPFEDWRDGGFPVSRIDEIDPMEAGDRVRAGARLLDVRQDAEVALGGIPGAEHIELGGIIAGAVPGSRDVITYCGHGQRSATAASLLARRGIRVANLRGGIAAWNAARQRAGAE